MNAFEQLIEDLESSEIDKKIKAIEYIEDKCYDLVPKLLDMLTNEDDINVLNALALCMGRLRINEAVPIIMGYIKNPDFKDKNGSFIYALLNLECRTYFLDFVKMMCEGNFEVFNHSFLIFESIIDDVNYELKFEAKEILEKQQKIELSKPQSKYPQYERINYINDALILLN
jgi:hypothetical protein